MSHSQLVAAPIEFVLDETRYRLSPLNDLDYGELDQWVQSRFVENAWRSVENAPKAVFDRVMAVAMRESMGITWMRPPGATMFNTPEGLARLIWQGLKRNHPGLTFETVMTWARDPKKLTRLNFEWNRANPAPPSVGKIGEGENGRPFPKTKSTPSSRKGSATRSKK